MRLGETGNVPEADLGKPLDGVRVLALEQMQALPWATQLLSRLGADVVKIEHPSGESARGSRPAMADPDGRAVGATFLRNNLNKRSVCVDLKHPRGRELILRLASHFDIVGENFRGGTLSRLGLGYSDLAAAHPGVIYLSVSGFGSAAPAPYGAWPAYAPIAEAMSGIYDFKRRGDQPPLVAPVGALGDIGTALFGVVGILAALRHRDRTGLGQHIDVAMLDSMVAMTDIVSNFWSMGLERGNLGPFIMHAFQREHQFASMARAIDHADWPGDARFAERQGWVDHLDTVIRPAVEEWASTKTTLEVCELFAAVGVAAGPCFTDEQLVHDPHVAARNMLVEIPRTDGVAAPILVPGNPIKFSRVAEGPETRVPWLGEHTDAILQAELGLSAAQLSELREDGAIA
jgi:crotonobetainyl-CoA:carnitine CoA-transferase CaiB-like acyl-CoA transferase